MNHSVTEKYAQYEVRNLCELDQSKNEQMVLPGIAEAKIGSLGTKSDSFTKDCESATGTTRWRERIGLNRLNELNEWNGLNDVNE